MALLRLTRCVLCILSAAALGAFPLAAGDSNPDGIAWFEKRIRPVLVDKCYKCHSQQSDKVKGGLLLDTRAHLLKGGESGPALLAGEPDKSLLIKAIRYHDQDLQMPPKDRLTDQEIVDFETWVKMGAPDPRSDQEASAPPPIQPSNHWSFKAPAPQQPPNVKNAPWARTDVDRFILAKLQEKGLTPAKDADRRVLIRRATFDLTGLPPTPEETQSFVSDRSPMAFEHVVDRLLSSRAYGERWGRHWLDLVRYADTSGCNSDYPILAVYKYRNYVIDSFNADKPYDEFLKEQLAGDLLPAGNDRERYEHIVATGYLAIARRFGSRASEFHLSIEDIIDNLGKTMLGLSVSCARCHDHKFDPIPNRDYYALYGIFNSTRYAFPGTEIYKHPKDFVPLTDAAQAEAYYKDTTELAALDDRIENLLEKKRSFERQDKVVAKADAKEGALAAERKDQVKVENYPTVAEVKAALEDAHSRQRALEAKVYPFERAYAVADSQPANAKIQKKGDPHALGEEVPRGFLQVLGGQQVQESMSSGRKELAEWIAEPHNPLTARVMVNRIWQNHFGKGIVASPNDFGARGKQPTHPELLDYLAQRFVEEGWSIKRMHRVIMLSHVYQIASDDHAENAAKDVNNDYLWKFSRRRLEAEEVRDTILAISGSLDRSQGGPHPFPPQNTWKYTQHTPFLETYDSLRRSVYLMQPRIHKNPFFEVWDGADPNAPTGERPVSTTPLQALFMMNNGFAHQQADQFAVRVGLVFPQTARRIDYAYRLAYGRPATREEIRLGEDYLARCERALHDTDTPADQRGRAALASYLRVVLSANEFLYID